MSRQGLLNEALTNKKVWSMRPPDVTRAAVNANVAKILSADQLWLDLNAHNIKDSVGLNDLQRTDPVAFEHAITNFWMTIWMIIQ